MIFAMQDGVQFYLFESEASEEPIKIIQAPYTPSSDSDVITARRARSWFNAKFPDAVFA